mmetsp:Transcript_23735/g.74714  ORF Transcript_23735/g.74714 Transcript_23735/m.74714 type:complete len:202 (+) Transcript_23735:258-863(+)
MSLRTLSQTWRKVFSMSTADTSQIVCRKTGKESSKEDMVCRAASSFFSWSSSLPCTPATSRCRFTAKALFATLDIACMRTFATWVLSRHDASCVSIVKLPRKFARYCSAQLSYTEPIVRNNRPPKDTRTSSLASCKMDVMKPASSRAVTHRSRRSASCIAHLTSRAICCRFICRSFFESADQRISRSIESPMTSRAGTFPS